MSPVNKLKRETKISNSNAKNKPNPNFRPSWIPIMLNVNPSNPINTKIPSVP